MSFSLLSAYLDFYHAVGPWTYALCCVAIVGSSMWFAGASLGRWRDEEPPHPPAWP